MYTPGDVEMVLVVAGWCFIDGGNWTVPNTKEFFNQITFISKIHSCFIYNKEKYTSENVCTISIPWHAHLFDQIFKHFCYMVRFWNQGIHWWGNLIDFTSLFFKNKKKINAIYWRRAQNKMISVFNNWTNSLIIFIIYHIQNEIFSLRIIRWGERSNTKNFSNIFQIVSVFYLVCLFVFLRQIYIGLHLTFTCVCLRRLLLLVFVLIHYFLSEF